MAKQSFVEAVGILDDGLAAVPNQPDLLAMARAPKRQFVAAKTPTTLSALTAATEAHTRAQAFAQSVKTVVNTAKARRAPAATTERTAKRKLQAAQAAMSRVAPHCATYERVSFGNRKCKHCGRRRTACEASQVAQSEVAKARIAHTSVRARAHDAS